MISKKTAAALLSLGGVHAASMHINGSWAVRSAWHATLLLPALASVCQCRQSCHRSCSRFDTRCPLLHALTYSARRHVMPPTPQEWVFAGLNLLLLLLANRIAEFHTELELIPEQVRRTGGWHFVRCVIKEV